MPPGSARLGSATHGTGRAILADARVQRPAAPQMLFKTSAFTSTQNNKDALIIDLSQLCIFVLASVSDFAFSRCMPLEFGFCCETNINVLRYQFHLAAVAAFRLIVRFGRLCVVFCLGARSLARSGSRARGGAVVGSAVWQSGFVPLVPELHCCRGSRGSRLVTSWASLVEAWWGEPLQRLGSCSWLLVGGRR